MYKSGELHSWCCGQGGCPLELFDQISLSTIDYKKADLMAELLQEKGYVLMLLHHEGCVDFTWSIRIGIGLTGTWTSL